MMQVFKKIILILVFTWSFTSFRAEAKSESCVLAPDKSYMVLSGAMGQLLKELDLLGDPALKGISAFALPLVGHKYESKLLSVGFHISQKWLDGLKHEKLIIFRDNGQNQERALRRVGHKIHEIRSLGKGSFEVFYHSLDMLKPYLVHCESRVVVLERKVKSIEEKLKKATPLKVPTVFFLGKMTPAKGMPHWIMVNDSFVKTFLDLGLIKSYPTPMPYITWSQKILNKMIKEGDVLLVGLAQGGNKPFIFEASKVYREGHRLIINVEDPRSLIPGISQVFFLKDFYFELTKSRRFI